MRFNVDDLVAKKLVTKKTYTDGPFAGLSVLKYKNNVFWDNLWDTDPRLLECRGMVVDADDNVVIWPFTKIFNRFENGTDLPLDTPVCAVRKVNGFMAAAGAYKGKLIVSTTGTLDSGFAKIAEDHIVSACNDVAHMVAWMESACATFIFEICDETDPHIVAENVGAYLIGIRIHHNDISESLMVPEAGLDGIAKSAGFKSPEVVHTVCVDEVTKRIANFSDIVDLANSCKHEGFVVRSLEAPYSLLLKIKSPHYLAKKFLMRGGKNKWDMIWDNPKAAKERIDEEYYTLLDYISNNFSKHTWNVMSSENRSRMIENYFKYQK